MAQKIIPVLTPITPYELYLQQVKGLYDGIRYERQGITYTPPQFGGIFGQLETIDASVVLELIDFEIT